MGRRPGAQVRVMDIQIRAKVKKTASGKNNVAAVKYVVRWVVDGVEKSRSFPLKVSADNFRTDIIQAIRDRENFRQGAMTLRCSKGCPDIFCKITILGSPLGE